ncbi:hypothetical protein GQ457_17G007400 [Hibiscus cannabinus]
MKFDWQGLQMNSVAVHGGVSKSKANDNSDVEYARDGIGCETLGAKGDVKSAWAELFLIQDMKKSNILVDVDSNDECLAFVVRLSNWLFGMIYVILKLSFNDNGYAFAQELNKVVFMNVKRYVGGEILYG